MKREKISGGIHTVQQLLADGKALRLYVADNKKSKNLAALVAEAQTRGVPVETVALYELEMMLPGVRHQGVAAVSEARGQAADWTDAIAGIEKPLLLVLDSIQDPHNLGACLRSAAAAGIRQIVLGEGCADAYSPKVLRAGMGAHFLLHIQERVCLTEWCARYPHAVYATALDGNRPALLYQLDLRAPCAWIFGNEGSGVSPELIALAGRSVKIPMQGATESLNIAQAATVCLFEQMRQRWQQQP